MSPIFVISANLTDREMLQLEEALAKQHSTIKMQTQDTTTLSKHNRHPSTLSDDLQLELEVAMAAQAQTVQVRLVCAAC